MSPPDSEDEESEAAEEEIPEEKTAVSQEMENQNGPSSDKKEVQTGMDPGSLKRQHLSDSSDSDKDPGIQNSESQIVIVSTEPTPGEWRKVEKKKGRKF